MNRRTLLAGLAPLPFLSLGGGVAAQDDMRLPAGPVRLVVSAPAGTAPDILIRHLRPRMEEILRQSVVVENRVGANGLLAADFVARSDPDQNTFLVTVAGTLTANPHLYAAAATRALDELAAVTTVATIDFLVAARADLGITSFAALLDRMRRDGADFTVATTAVGSFPFLAAEMLKQRAGLQFVIVPAAGGAQAATMVAGGHAHVVIETLAVLNPLITGGRLVPLASTGPTRGSLTPDLPAVAEAGLTGYQLTGWIALAAPRRMSLPQRVAVQRAAATAAAEPAVRGRIEALNFSVVAEDVATSERRWANEREALGQVIRTAGIRLD